MSNNCTPWSFFCITGILRSLEPHLELAAPHMRWGTYCHCVGQIWGLLETVAIEGILNLPGLLLNPNSWLVNTVVANWRPCSQRVG